MGAAGGEEGGGGVGGGEGGGGEGEGGGGDGGGASHAPTKLLHAEPYWLKNAALPNHSCAQRVRYLL